MLTTTTQQTAQQINHARAFYIQQRVQEMMADPVELSNVIVYAAKRHPTKVGTQMQHVVNFDLFANDHIGATLRKAAEDIAQAEFFGAAP